MNLNGLRDDQIRTNKADVADVANAVQQLSGGDDLVILPDSDTTDRHSFFNNLHDDIEEAVNCPVLVILREENDSN